MGNAIAQHKQLVGRRVRAARKLAGLSLDKLGARVGTSRQHLIRIERGDHLPRPELLNAIGEATGQHPEFFESEDDEESDLAIDLLRRAIQAMVRDETRKVSA